MNRRLTPPSLTTLGIALAAFVAVGVASTPAWSATAGTAGRHHHHHAEAPVTGETPAAIEHTDAKDEHREAKAENAEETENIGFPQLKEVNTFPSQIFWLLVSFTLLYALMSKLALPRVAAVIETRQQAENGNLSRAEELNAEAAKVKEAYEASLAKAHDSAQEVLAAAEGDISEKLSAENDKFAEHARKRLLSAEQNIAKAKEEAMASLADISAEIAAEMVNKISGVQVAKADARKVVTQVMKESA